MICVYGCGCERSLPLLTCSKMWPSMHTRFGLLQRSRAGEVGDAFTYKQTLHACKPQEPSICTEDCMKDSLRVSQCYSLLISLMSYVDVVCEAEISYSEENACKHYNL